MRTLARGRVYLQQWTYVSVLSADVTAASEMVTEFYLGLRLPDAIHLAIAKRLGFILITSDRKQGHAAAALAIAYVDPNYPPKEPA